MAGYSLVFWYCGEQRHSMTGASTSPSTIRPRTCSLSVCTRRDLPRPGSPMSRTTWPMPSRACSQRSFSRLISWSRPVSGVSPAGTAASIALLALADALDLEELDGLRHALELSRANACALELAPDQPVGCLATNDLAGCGDVLQPDRHVPRLPHQRDRIVLGLDDGRPSVEADPRVQLQLVLAVERLADAVQVLEQAQGGAGSAARAVLVSHRVAETDQ